MARHAQRQAIGDFEPEFGVRCPRLDMVNMQGCVSRAAFLTGFLVASEDALAPLNVLPTRSVSLAFIAPSCVSTLPRTSLAVPSADVREMRSKGCAAIAARPIHVRIATRCGAKALPRTIQVIAASSLRWLSAERFSAVSAWNCLGQCASGIFTGLRTVLSAPFRHKRRSDSEVDSAVQASADKAGRLMGHSGLLSRVWGAMPRGVSAPPGLSLAHNFTTQAVAR